METTYFVYTKINQAVPVVSIKELPKSITFKAQKYLGKLARIEAVFRFDGTVLNKTLSSASIKEYIQNNIKSSGRWKEFYSLFKSISEEKENVEETFEFCFKLKVNFTDTVLTGSGKRLAVVPDDPNIIHMVTSELLGKGLSSYDGLRNPILSISKETFTGSLDKCFAYIIEKRGWHNKSKYDRKSAYYHKLQFKKGLLSDEVKREYLIASGGIKTSEEQWNLK